MYEVTRNVIQSGRFELTDILAKIDTLWIRGDITETQRLELTAMARAKADPAGSFAPLQAQIDALAARISALEGNKGTDEGYPAYVQPTGSHDAYHAGDQVTFGGKQYVCIAPGGVTVVWDPATYPAYWEEVQ